MPEENKKEYVVREGRTFGVNALGPGEVVELTDQEAAAFADLVELRVKPKKGADQNADTRDTAKNEENIGNKSADEGTVREQPAKRK
jgi:hypothetical protein